MEGQQPRHEPVPRWDAGVPGSFPCCATMLAPACHFPRLHKYLVQKPLTQLHRPFPVLSFQYFSPSDVVTPKAQPQLPPGVPVSTLLTSLHCPTGRMSCQHLLTLGQNDPKHPPRATGKQCPPGLNQKGSPHTIPGRRWQGCRPGPQRERLFSSSPEHG